jgi:hypothetical protein
MKTPCPKSGIKIHETKQQQQPQKPLNGNTNQKQYQTYLQNQSQLKKPVNFHTTTLDTLDLDLEHYSLEDIYHLFNIPDNILTDTSLKEAKKVVLKIHPDKSRLDAKYFLFFSQAYKVLFGIYEFQNKSSRKTYKDEDFYDESNKVLLNNMFETNKALKDPKQFQSWFNESFEKHRLDNPIDNGYENWLKSNEGFIEVDENITKSNMNDVFEQKKRQIQQLTVYNGIGDTYSSAFGASSLNNDVSNFTTDQYTDLKQAYTETLIAVTNDDFEKIQTFNNLSDFKRHRDSTDTTPLSKEEALHMLHKNNTKLEEDSAALAFKYARDAVRLQQKQQSFWGDIKQLKG